MLYRKKQIKNCPNIYARLNWKIKSKCYSFMKQLLSSVLSITYWCVELTLLTYSLTWRSMDINMHSCINSRSDSFRSHIHLILCNLIIQLSTHLLSVSCWACRASLCSWGQVPEARWKKAFDDNQRPASMPHRKQRMINVQISPSVLIQDSFDQSSWKSNACCWISMKIYPPSSQALHSALSKIRTAWRLPSDFIIKVLRRRLHTPVIVMNSVFWSAAQKL